MPGKNSIKEYVQRAMAKDRLNAIEARKKKVCQSRAKIMLAYILQLIIPFDTACMHVSLMASLFSFCDWFMNLICRLVVKTSALSNNGDFQSTLL